MTTQVRMSITLDDEHICGSPFYVTVIPTGLFNVGFWGDLSKPKGEALLSIFALKGVGLECAVAGERAVFNISSGKAAKESDLPAERFLLELRGPDYVTARRPVLPAASTRCLVPCRPPRSGRSPSLLTADWVLLSGCYCYSRGVTGVVEGPMDGGHYQASYCCTTTGLYTGTVKVGRFPLPGCPFQVVVRPDLTDPGQCTAVGSGMYECMEGEEASFVVEVRRRVGEATTNRARRRRRADTTLPAVSLIVLYSRQL
eukprot:6810241-Pyramimonas_sp.AAC.1